MEYDPHACAYCGYPADTIDHVSPASYFRVLDEFKEDALADMIVGVCVPACRECNCAILGAYPEWQFGERVAAHKRLFYKRHYKSFLRPLWGEEETEELGRGLKSFVRKLDAEDRSIMERYKFVTPFEFITDVEYIQFGLDLTCRRVER
jgi:hypothetical protein